MSDLPIIITTGTIIFILIAVFITFFLYSYRQRLNAHFREKEDLKNLYQQEILKAQLEMQEQTFLSISQEIHDNIGQILSLIKLNISTIRPNDLPSSATKIYSSKELLDQAIEDLRNLSKRLNSQFVTHQNLSELIQFQLNLIQKTGLYKTHFNLHGHEKQLNSDTKLIIFRIMQEVFNNIIKHAGAATITVQFDCLPEKILITIIDDGQGFTMDNNDPINCINNEVSPGIGVSNMYYRARLINAEFNLQSLPGKGTTAQISLPINA